MSTKKVDQSRTNCLAIWISSWVRVSIGESLSINKIKAAFCSMVRVSISFERLVSIGCGGPTAENTGPRPNSMNDGLILKIDKSLILLRFDMFLLPDLQLAILLLSTSNMTLSS